ncbi:MAG: glycosyltransferase family 4 protein [Bdellovibrionota bacterium]
MKILWLSHFTPYPDTGFGALQRSRGLLQGIAEHHEVSLITLTRGLDIHDAHLFEQARTDLERFCECVIFAAPDESRCFPSQAAVLLRSAIRNRPYSVELFRSRQMTDAVSLLLSRERFDLVHADTLGLVEDLLPSIRCPVVLNHHNVESSMMRRRASLQTNALKKAFFSWEAAKLESYERTYGPRFALHVAVSGDDASEIATFAGKAPVVIVENPVDCDYWKPRSGVPFNREMLFVGGMDWYPNRDAVIYFCREIFPEVRRKYPDARLTVVGRVPDGGIDLGDASAGVTFTGFVDDVREYFHRARVFVCPMRDGGGTKLKVVNAFASGIPVVSTRFGASGLECQDGAQLLLAETPEEFAAQISRAFEDSDLCLKLQTTARQFVCERYSTKGLAERLSVEYAKVKQPN